jgi:hypothetical protein
MEPKQPTGETAGLRKEVHEDELDPHRPSKTPGASCVRGTNASSAAQTGGDGSHTGGAK